MAGNTFGKNFRLTTFGESHGPAVGGIIDGCPAGLKIDLQKIKVELSRRKPGQSEITSARMEEDDVEVLSGIFNGITTGAPIAFLIRNKDQKPTDYSNIEGVFRPSHADYTYFQKYGLRDHRGSGRSSARETVARVFGGAVAKQLLELNGVSVAAFVSQIGKIKLEKAIDKPDISLVENSAVRCPDPVTSEKMILYLKELIAEGDSTGGIIQCHIHGVPPGWGEPVFDKLHADLGKGMLSINAAHGFEYGSGFDGASMTGSEHNDVFSKDGSGNIITETNHSGGIQGGISNGMNIYFRVAFKPVSTIKKPQSTLNEKGEPMELKVNGRHDPCVVPRAVPIVEAMASLVLADHFLRNKSSKIGLS
jgi:chorismate synthase